MTLVIAVLVAYLVIAFVIRVRKAWQAAAESEFERQQRQRIGRP